MNFDQIGEKVIGSRLRSLSNEITREAQEIYDLYGVELKPNWFPVIYVLQQQSAPTSITEIANEIGHSHPSVVKIVKQMVKAGLVVESKGKKDKRRNNISLSEKGQETVRRIEPLYADVEEVIKGLLSRTRHNLWLAIQEFEYLLNEKSLLDRVMEQKKETASANVEIVQYEPKHQTAFKQLNQEWIEKYFKIEETDTKALDNPDGYILSKGGEILVAVENDKVLGVCALIKMEDEEYDFELAKMAVSPIAHGRGIGMLLGKAIIDKARTLGASKIYLESNSVLKPALSLYQKLGFKKIAGRHTPYERCDIQMGLDV